MIKNERQYRITKAAAERFQSALKEIEAAAGPSPDVHPIIHKAEKDALRSQLEDLKSDLREYEELASGRVEVLMLDSLSDLSTALVRARISAGLSQKDLAKRLGMKEQQVQRYEATDYQQASWSRILEIAHALDLNVSKEVFLPKQGRTLSGVLASLRGIGLSKDFVLNRLLPRGLWEIASKDGGDHQDRVFFEIVRAVSHVFGWTPSAILGDERPWLAKGVLGAARFKVSASAEERFLTVYTFYAHYIALLLLGMTRDMPTTAIPTDPAAMRKAISDKYGEVSLRSALLYCWDLGIPVLPLSDEGAFHGATWRVNGRNVIVLKQRTRSIARWLFDLLHELRHAAEQPSELQHSVVEEAEGVLGAVMPDEEQEASWFAGEVILDGRAESLAHHCEKRARGSIERLKGVVLDVAREEKVDQAALANYLAFRLSLQGTNWWGAASNLQPQDENPWAIARDVLLSRVEMTHLSGLDKSLFVQALSEPEGVRK